MTNKSREEKLGDIGAASLVALVIGVLIGAATLWGWLGISIALIGASFVGFGIVLFTPS